MNAGGAEYDYLDDDFDLPESTIQELDRSAATLSQRLPQRLVPNVPVHTAAGNVGQVPKQAALDPPSSDYGFDDDDDVINLDAGPDLLFNQVVTNANATLARPATERPTGHGATQGQQDATDRLQSRLAELDRERVNLQKELESTKSDATAKAGAIAILRSKHEKSTRDYERKLAVMQQLHADELSRQKHELELVRRDQETTKTSNKFLEHDLAQEVEKSKALHAPRLTNLAPSVPRAPQAVDSRPNYSDGFSKDEVMVISPPAKKQKSKDVTPKLGRKRKRMAESSPTVPLDIQSPVAAVLEQDPISIEGEVDVQHAEQGLNLLRQLHSRDEDLETLRQVMEHGFPGYHGRTIEELARYSFPDEPGSTVAGDFLAELSSPSISAGTSKAVAVCSICMRLWDRCLRSKYYIPLVPILDLFQTILFTVPISHQVPWIQQMVRLASKTVDLLAVPRALALREAASPSKEELSKRHAIEETVDDDTALSLLRTTACSAGIKHDTAREFWKAMEFDFVLLMMHKAQPLHQMTIMLQIVPTSVLPDSFGVIDASGKRQSGYQSDLLDRLTLLLFEDLVAPEDEPPYSRDEYAELHIQVLQAIRAISAVALGSRAIAEHKTAIGRLIRFLHAQMVALYEVPLSIDAEASLHDKVMQSVNLTTRIIYHLLREHADTISIRDKVSVIHGGWHKFLVALSRIAFSDRVAFEAGLEDEVVDAAHEILDAVLSPEEGEAIVMAVETPRTVGVGSRASMPVVLPNADSTDEVMT